jgi:hypothetical protein
VDSVRTVAFDQLDGCDPMLDRVYKGGTAGNSADDPPARLLPGVGNQGRFPTMGKAAKDGLRLDSREPRSQGDMALACGHW